jgi:thiamine-phosphate pyrophosphorylase
MMRGKLPKLYVILDAGQCGGSEVHCAKQLLEVGVRLFQYRNKTAPAREVLQTASELAKAVIPTGGLFFVNDRPDVAYLAGASGVHVGQGDLLAEDAKRIMGPEKFIGVSTHNVEQFKAATGGVADYIAVGPIYATSTKEKPDPVVGTALLKQIRRLTEKPIVAIGGITLERAGEVIEAGADSVAVANDILSAPSPVERAQQYVETLGSVRSSRTN